MFMETVCSTYLVWQYAHFNFQCIIFKYKRYGFIHQNSQHPFAMNLYQGNRSPLVNKTQHAQCKLN